MLTAVQLFTGERGHFHALVCSCAWCHVICRAVCIGKLQVKDFQVPHVTWWFFGEGTLKGILNRICGFLLVVERNGYFVYFSFVVQAFCNKKMKHNELFKEWPHLLLNLFCFFLIGTENVKQNRVVLNETQCWNEDSWWGINEPNTSERLQWWLPFTLWGGRGEHAPYRNVSIMHCTITKIKPAMR